MNTGKKQTESEEEGGETGWVISAPTPEFQAALREGVDKAILTAGPDFGKALKNLEAAVRRVPAFDLICFNSLYFLSTVAGTNPEFDRPEGIFQHHVELMQAVALRQPIEEARPEVHNQQGVGDVTTAATAVLNASQFWRPRASRVQKARMRRGARWRLHRSGFTRPWCVATLTTARSSLPSSSCLVH
jgi:hypothetical protein